MVALLPAPKSKEGNSGKKNLRRGNPGNKGGGRHKADFTKFCQSLEDKYALVERLAKMGGGEAILHLEGFDKEGKPEVVFHPARAQDQINAAKVVIAYARGNPPETIIHEGETERYVMVSPRMPSSVEEWRKMFLPSKS